MVQKNVKAQFNEQAVLYGEPIKVNVTCKKKYSDCYSDDKLNLKKGDKLSIWIGYGKNRHTQKDEIFFVRADGGGLYSTNEELFEFSVKGVDLSQYVEAEKMSFIKRFCKNARFQTFDEMIAFIKKVTENMAEAQRAAVLKAISCQKELPTKEFRRLSFEEISVTLAHLNFLAGKCENEQKSLRLFFNAEKAGRGFVIGYNEIFKEYVPSRHENLEFFNSILMYNSAKSFEGPNGETEELFKKVVTH